MHRNRDEEDWRHHKGYRTERRRRLVSLAAVHRAVVHHSHLAAHFGRHVVAAVLMPSLMRGNGIRVRRNVALVMMLRNVAKPSRAARHRRRRKRSRRHRRIQKRNREQASQRAKHPLSIVVSAIQGRSKNGQAADVSPIGLLYDKPAARPPRLKDVDPL